MSHTDRLIEESRERARVRANVLLSGLGQRLHLLNKPEYARLRVGLDKLKARHISLLNVAIEADIITEADYRRFMADYIDEISLADLLTSI